MNKRLSLLLNESTNQSYMQKTTRTQLSDEEERIGNEWGVSRAISILQPQQLEQDKSKTGRRFVEFEEFNGDGAPVYQYQPNVKRKFNIEVPQTKFEIQPAMSDHVRLPNAISPSGGTCREPPAPLHRGPPKAFIFPVTNNNPMSSKSNFLTKQPSSIPNIAHFEKAKIATEQLIPQSESPVSNSINDQTQLYSIKLERLSHQQLLRTAEIYRKELLKKDAQIQVLQRIIADNIAARLKQTNININNIDSTRLLKEKDDLKCQLMNKLTQLTNTLRIKNQELSLCKYQNNKMECTIEAMTNEAYLVSKQQHAEMLSYVNDKDRRQVSTHWQEDVIRTSVNKNNCVRQIEDIQKKFDMLKNQKHLPQQQSSTNHMSMTAALQDGGRSLTGIVSLAKKNKSGASVSNKPIKDESQQNTWYCQTSKNRPKASGYFDFRQQPQAKENISDIAIQQQQQRKKHRNKELLL